MISNIIIKVVLLGSHIRAKLQRNSAISKSNEVIYYNTALAFFLFFKRLEYHSMKVLRNCVS